MNTGVHDAINLSWKLGGVVKGWYAPGILQTYEDERRPAAQHLIKLDKAFSATISGTVPEEYKGTSLNANELSTKLIDDTILFNLGLEINYGESIINKAPPTGMISSGRRGPDALIMAPDSRVPIRLYQVTRNTGQWSVLIFAGQPLITHDSLALSVSKLKELQAILPKDMVRFLTLVADSPDGGDRMFGTPRIGNIYYDNTRSAHEKYTISTGKGAVVVLRPDGILGYATTLDDSESIRNFFTDFASII
jgi:phenol 2-monooxygenase